MSPLHRFALLPAALGLALLAAPAAQAFTFEKSAGDSGGGAQLAPGVNPYVSPFDDTGASADTGDGVKSFSKDGVTTLERNGMFLQFGHERSFNENFDPRPLFDPLRR
jgi:hypothetical protein